jgi:hypothetical protein
MFTTHPHRGVVRRRTRVVRPLVALLVSAGAATALAGPAQAYDRSTCDQQIGASNVESVDTVRADHGQAGEVDFGDLLHLGGTPMGNAVVCWQKNGRVHVVGRLFADPSDGHAKVTAKIDYFDSNGTAIDYFNTWEVTGTWWVADRRVIDATPPGQVVNKVRIRLFNEGTLIATHPRYRA